MSLPGFRASCLTLAGIYALIAGSILLRGPMVAMADYSVPASTLASPHYADAMFWVFLHMTGTALYKGKGSLGPVLVDALALILWLRLNIVRPTAVQTAP